MSPASNLHVLEDVLDPVGDCFTPEVAQRVADLRASPATQARLDELAEKSSDGRLTPEETAEYKTYVTAINFLGILQAKARAVLGRTGKS